MKKLFKYFGNIFNTYGILTPLVIIALLYVAIIAMDKNDALTAILHASKGWFITLACIGSLALIACVVLIIWKATSDEINVVDLLLLVFAILALLVLIMFCFEPGVAGASTTIIKWTVASVILVASVALSVLRSAKVK